MEAFLVTRARIQIQSLSKRRPCLRKECWRTMHLEPRAKDRGSRDHTCVGSQSMILLLEMMQTFAAVATKTWERCQKPFYSRSCNFASEGLLV